MNEARLPTRSEIVRALLGVARDHPGIACDDHVEAAIGALAAEPGPELETVVDHVLDELVYGPLHWLPGDATVYVPDVIDGATFTHRLNESALALGVLTVGFDAGPFGRFDTITLQDATPLEPYSVEYGHLAWRGPEGWLDEYEIGSLLAITASAGWNDDEERLEGVISIAVVDHEPEPLDALIGAAHAAYDALVDGPGLPVGGEELGLWLRFHNRELFDRPQAPLSDVCDAIGLERRAGFVAHDAAIWRQELLRQRLHVVRALVPETKWRLTIGRALEALDEPGASVEAIRTALDECADPVALDVLADVLIPHYLDLDDDFEIGESDETFALRELVDRALAVARRPREIATAEYLAAVFHERSAAPDQAEAHLARSVQARPQLGPVVERMGWYRFDRGDAQGAMRWWRQLAELPEAAATIMALADPTAAGPKLGRNDPCWCGSGRKFKQCHLGANDLPTLPDRVGWLARKSTTWLEHANSEPRSVVTDLVAAYVSGDPDVLDLGNLDLDDERLQMAFTDPIIFDAALHEGGLFSLFLHERGALLPEDEQLLAASWKTVERSVHEVVDVDPGIGLTLRDLASGEVSAVRERAASRSVKVGERYCARVLPDGESHQLVGGVFPVRTGHENAVLELCASRDDLALCAWVGALYSPPRIVHRPGMLEEKFDLAAMQSTLDSFGGKGDQASALAALSAEMSRQARTKWLDEHIPALDGLTPREAAADPTRREQLERLLLEFDAHRERIDSSAPFDGMIPIDYDVPGLRRELGLD